MVIRKTVCRDCDNAIPHNTECCPGYVSADPFDYYRNTDRLLCLLTLPLSDRLLLQRQVCTVAVGARRRARPADERPPISVRLCQTVTVTHQLPDKYEKTSAEVGNARKSAHYRLHLRTPFPFGFRILCCRYTV